ncbi:MAG: nuclear transport factor 2 family protein [Gemmatimonadota bacterium]
MRVQMMRRLRVSLGCLTALLLVRSPVVAQSSAAIDADVWRAIATSVVNADITAMGRTYHPDAVLVSSAGTRPISQVLAGWGKDMDTNTAKGTRATVEFRFTLRQDDAESAFEAGVFRYTVFDKAGASTPSYRRLETLLVKQGGTWRILMERQLDAVTQQVWDGLKH